MPVNALRLLSRTVKVSRFVRNIFWRSTAMSVLQFARGFNARGPQVDGAKGKISSVRMAPSPNERETVVMRFRADDSVETIRRRRRLARNAVENCLRWKLDNQDAEIQSLRAMLCERRAA